jgi:hypothetical protein
MSSAEIAAIVYISLMCAIIVFGIGGVIGKGLGESSLTNCIAGERVVRDNVVYVCNPVYDISSGQIVEG